MAFTPKDWRNATTHEGGGDETTPITAAAIEDLETRVTDYADSIAGGGFNVMNYGAVGNGVADDTAAFGTTRDAAGVGGVVYVPEGTYLIDSLALNVADQTWQFAPNATIKLPDNQANSILEVRENGISLIGGKWDGNLANQAPSFNSALIYVYGAEEGWGEKTLLRDLHIYDTQSGGIGGGGVRDLAIERCRIVNTRDWGIVINNTVGDVAGGGVRISDCYIDTSLDTGDYAGSYKTPITVYGATGLPFTGVDITNNYVKAPDNDSGAIEPRLVEGCSISNNTVIGSLLGITIGQDCNNCTITGNSIKGVGSASSGISIEIGSSHNVAVSGNSIDGDGKSTDGGIVVTGVADPSTNILVTGNAITGLPATSFGLRVEQSFNEGLAFIGNYVEGQGFTSIEDHTDLVVADNVFAGGGAEYGIQFANLVTGTRRYTVQNNVFSDYSVGGIRFWGNAGAATWSEAIVKDNIFRDCTANISIAGTTPTFDGTCYIEGNGPPIVASAATVTIPPHAKVVVISGTANITSITADLHRPDPVTLQFTGTASGTGLTDGSNLKLASNLVYTPDDAITLVCNGTNWYETGRSVN